jgi:hypothetical protein
MAATTNLEVVVISFSSSRFQPGQLLMTPGAIDALRQTEEDIWRFLRRHLACDWGDLSPEDVQLNDEALQDGSRILSAYHLSNGTKIWIITEAADDEGIRVATTVLLPEEY